MVKNLSLGTGRRKTAVARVYLREGSGAVSVNGKSVDDYFNNPSFVYVVRQPLAVTDSEGKFDIVINVKGGGPSGQAGACRHGLARALVEYDAGNLTSLRANGFLTRDPRMVERKKYGQRGARRRFQFSKR
ncbi:30S ribosomal protein S9 [Sediminispirochaeta smaragdinae]|uniref:Small ribosomal subunit protein uS9 n=1 Tax=Sediminispirochaeta smaragdinae (strain DSM 11293 / JCM 15392 / SEBR 4228) TaxID=573413 RepID=E1R7Y3_SEDSS|nr:30S ribosomal protein S9 [Sediminispirochaeta smaragdinae]ADK82838.1 ribosomal protein S9 [Sediminispirochaeta smaragdinae DSM 11293]